MLHDTLLLISLVRRPSRFRLHEDADDTIVSWFTFNNCKRHFTPRWVNCIADLFRDLLEFERESDIKQCAQDYTTSLRVRLNPGWQQLSYSIWLLGKHWAALCTLSKANHSYRMVRLSVLAFAFQHFLSKIRLRRYARMFKATIYVLVSMVLMQVIIAIVVSWHRKQK